MNIQKISSFQIPISQVIHLLINASKNNKFPKRTKFIDFILFQPDIFLS